MNEEVLKFRGRLAATELEAKNREIAAKGLVNSLRNLLDPFEALEELSDEQILDQALRLANMLIAYREKRAEIAALRKALGR